jgi:hypothetical protein
MRVEDPHFRYCASTLPPKRNVRVPGTLDYTDSAQGLKAVCEQRISMFPEFFLRIWGAHQIGAVFTDEICRACGYFPCLLECGIK